MAKSDQLTVSFENGAWNCDWPGREDHWPRRLEKEVLFSNSPSDIGIVFRPGELNDYISGRFPDFQKVELANITDPERLTKYLLAVIKGGVAARLEQGTIKVLDVTFPRPGGIPAKDACGAVDMVARVLHIDRGDYHDSSISRNETDDQPDHGTSLAEILPGQTESTTAAGDKPSDTIYNVPSRGGELIEIKRDPGKELAFCIRSQQSKSVKIVVPLEKSWGEAIYLLGLTDAGENSCGVFVLANGCPMALKIDDCSEGEAFLELTEDRRYRLWFTIEDCQRHEKLQPLQRFHNTGVVLFGESTLTP